MARLEDTSSKFEAPVAAEKTAGTDFLAQPGSQAAITAMRGTETAAATMAAFDGNNAFTIVDSSASKGGDSAGKLGGGTPEKPAVPNGAETAAGRDTTGSGASRFGAMTANSTMDIHLPGNNEPSVTPGSNLSLMNSFGATTRNLMESTIPAQLKRK